MERKIAKAEQQMKREMDRQVDIVFGSAVIALYQYKGFRRLRLSRVLNVTQDAWNECAADNNLSMLRMLEEEVGIEMKRAGSDRSWHELVYLNGEMDRSVLRDKNKYLYMRLQQVKWIGPQIMASLLLTLRRKEGWGFKRLTWLMNESNAIAASYGYDPDAIRVAAWELSGVDVAKVDKDRKEGGGKNGPTK